MNFTPTNQARIDIWFFLLRTLARRAGSIAILFWGGWLALAAFESNLGSNLVVSVLFSLSLPLLVGLLTWNSRSFAWVIQQRFLAIAMMGFNDGLYGTVAVFIDNSRRHGGNGQPQIHAREPLNDTVCLR